MKTAQIERLRVSLPPVVAALFIDARGCYADLPRVDPWDEKRDARRYSGPWPVVAHPPCARWCRLAGLVEARWGLRRGDDGGCFASALGSVRRWGGVLEHPAYSDAWEAHGISRPITGGRWVRADDFGWTCYVEQHRYGHRAKKAAWLYVVSPLPLPELRWGILSDKRAQALVSWCGNRVASGEKRPRLTKRERSATPLEFRDLLLTIARSAAGHRMAS